MTYTVRKPGSRRALFRHPEFGWIWSRPNLATELTLADAEEMAKKLGGTVCRDGQPLGVTKPKKPKFSTEKAPGERDKVTELKALMAIGDWPSALKKAARFSQLGDERDAIKRGWEACARPELFRQMRRDPGAIREAGIAALKRRFWK